MKLDQGVIPEACLRLRRAIIIIIIKCIFIAQNRVMQLMRIVNMENQVRVLVGAFGIIMIWTIHIMH